MVRGVMWAGLLEEKSTLRLGVAQTKMSTPSAQLLKGVIRTNALEIEQGENGSGYGRT